MSHRGRRSSALPLATLAPPAAALGGWQRLGEPFHGAGLITLLTVGVLLGLMAPGMLVSLGKAPLLLVPAKTRARYRQRRPRAEQRSQRISARLRRAVYAADRHQCVWCGARDLNIDHIRPWAGGGLTAIWNLMTLCSACNVAKSNYWRDRDGYIHYHPGLGSPNMAMAADILRYERWHRLSPARWVRAGFSLAA